jgi:hypothetical protein
MSTMSTLVHPTPRRTHLAAVIASLLAVAGLLAGCSAGDSDSGGADQPAGSDQSVDFQGEEAYSDGDAAAEGEAGDDSRSSTVDRSVIITGNLYMTVEDPIAAADRAAGIVRNAGGRIDARNETAPDEHYGGSAALTLRIPSDRLDAAVADLRELGTVDEFSTDSYDVTTEVTDLAARISTLRASTERIERLLLEAKNISDIITLENELDRRQAELESLEAHQRGLNDQVSMSTIELSLTTEPVVIVDDAPETFWDGLETGWNGLVGFLSIALVIIGVVLPWIALMAVIVLAVVVAVRARKSRTAHGVAAPAVSPTATEQPDPFPAPPTS